MPIDPNVRPLLVPPAPYRERLPRWCALADILRLGEDDLALLLPGVSLVRDFERRTTSAEAMVYWPMILLMTRRLARKCPQRA